MYSEEVNHSEVANSTTLFQFCTFLKAANCHNIKNYRKVSNLHS